VTVVVGVDGAGRTHRLGEIATAAGLPAVRVDGASGSDADVAARLETARAAGGMVVVDDAHRLAGDALRALAAAARTGVRVVVSRRPTVDTPELAELDEAVAAQGPVELLAPLDGDRLAALVAAVTGRPAAPERVSAIRTASAGLPAVAAALATADPPTGPAPPALLARVQRQLTRLSPAAAEVARTLALGLDLPDDVLAGAAGVAAGELARAMRGLRDAGLLAPGGEHLVPAVGGALLDELTATERRRIHDAVARALLAGGADPVDAATQLRAARARTAAAAAAYRAAADGLRFTDPAAAMTWYDDALDAGCDDALLRAGRAEAAALLGLPVDLEVAVTDAVETVRLALVAGAVAAHQGRADRCAETLLGTDPPGPVLAVPALIAVGRPADARAALAPVERVRDSTPAGSPDSLRRLAEGALAAGDPAGALPLLIEAAEAVERTRPAVVLPETPHALGALVAVAAGDAATAEHLLERALAAGTGGPVARDRHRALLAWVRMRTGRYDTAVAELRRLAGAALGGRDGLLVAGLAAGLARRSGDIARLREAWTSAEPVLARRAVDLFQVEVVEELLVAAARLRQSQRIAPVLDAFDGILDRLGSPTAWTVAACWVRLQVALATEDDRGATAVASRLAAVDPVGTAPRQAAQCAAAQHWVRAMAGDVDADAIVRATEDLVAAQLPWEASRLAGHAAIRVADAAAARRLLEHARDLSRAEVPAADGGSDGGRGALSDREVEVARLVLAGRTHREIGAQLYLSPKTVEHHVARIRTKLGATSRAEMVAALHAALGDDPS
jgi:DNA-binding CsgD family transcriptional regulator